MKTDDKHLNTGGSADAKGGEHQRKNCDGPEHQEAGGHLIGGGHALGQRLAKMDHDAQRLLYKQINHSSDGFLKDIDTKGKVAAF